MSDRGLQEGAKDSLLDLRLERDAGRRGGDGAKGGGFALRLRVAWDARVAVLFGPSGSGKTTLLEAIVGYHPEARGRVRLAGRWLQDDEAGLRRRVEARRLGWVPQAPTLLPHLTVAGNLALGAKRAGDEGPRLLARAVEVLEIGPLLERAVQQLSGGEQQRVALARALASGPRALLLDEPLAALDLPLRARVLPYLLRVRDELGLPMVYITHDPDEAMLIGEFVAVLDAGRLIASGAVREVLWSRAIRPLSEALGVENVIEAVGLGARVGESRVRSSGGLELVIPGSLASGERVRLGLRAEDVLLAPEPPGRISARNVFACRVVACEALSGELRVQLRAGDAPGELLVARVTEGAARELGIRAGSELHAVVKAYALRRLA